MKMEKEVYEAFESIVGPDNITDDPVLLDTYRTPLHQSQNHYGPHFREFTPRGMAVLMPGSTEEVQNIVRLCNKYKIKFKASSTFWSSMGNISHDDAIQLDMRRMNRIVKIDVDQHYAVIEPYVIGATLQAEAMKVGLNNCIIGAGSSCSVLAGVSGWGAVGPNGIFMGSNGESLMGLEWVMPDGDIMRTGSLNSTGEWFCGEGPGPSMKGLVRGGMGIVGAFGVCTKIAIRLSPWPGPKWLQNTGTVPVYKADLPDNITMYTLCFPSWQAWGEAAHMLFRSEVAYLAHRQFNMFGRDLKGAMLRILTNPDGKLSDFDALLADPKVKEQTAEMKIEFQLVIAGMTKREFDYKNKVIDKILADTGGWKASISEEPDMKNWMLLYLIRLGHKALNFVYAGGYEGCFGLPGPHLDYGVARVEEAAQFKLKWELEHDSIANAGGDTAMLSLSGAGGGGQGAIWEFFTVFDSHDKASTDGTRDFHQATQDLSQKNGWGGSMAVSNSGNRDPKGYAVKEEIQQERLAKSPQPQSAIYQWKIREAFNPNHLGDSYYQVLKPKE